MCVRVPLPPPSYSLGRHLPHDSLSRGHSGCRGLTACAHDLGIGILSCPCQRWARFVGVRMCCSSRRQNRLGSGTADNPVFAKKLFQPRPCNPSSPLFTEGSLGRRWAGLCPKGLWPLVIGRAGIRLCPFSPDVAFRYGLVQGTCWLAGGPSCVGILVPRAYSLPWEVGGNRTSPGLSAPQWESCHCPRPREAHGRGSSRSGLLCSH